ADERMNLALRHIQRNIVGGQQGPVPLDESTGLKGGLRLRGTRIGQARPVLLVRHGPHPATAGRRLRLQFAGSAASPCGAASTTTSSRTPSGRCQYSVYIRRNSSRLSSTTAPTTPPYRIPMPPTMTMMRRLADCVQCIMPGETKRLWLASSAPANPATAPA